VLEERGEDPTEAYARADAECYPAEFRAGRDAALELVVELVRDGDGPVLDVATGRGGLLGRLVASGSSRPLIATDVSPHVLRRTERRIPGPRYVVAMHLFYDTSDEVNRTAARELGLEELLVRESALAAFADAGWSVSVEYERDVLAAPTPTSALVPEVGIDGLPVHEARATWCVLRAT
jgi:hypothetical protein